jgi:prepilin-type N-terminal cleavage/methylation domain-containing protein
LKRRGFSLVELIVVIVVLAVIAGIIIPVMYDMVDKSRVASQAKNISAWNEMYASACAASSDFASKAEWNTVSNDLAAGVTAQVGNQAVTFACQKPQFINAGEPTFVPGKGITAAP